MQLVFVRWLRTQQVAHEVVPSAPRHVERRAPIAVVLVGQKQQIKILVGLDEFVHHQQRVVRRNVVIQRAVRQQQVSLQILSEVLIGLIIVIGSPVGIFYQQPLIPFSQSSSYSRLSWFPDSEMPTLKKSG